MEGTVYKITNPKGKIYVGSTTRPLSKRMYSYRRLNCKGQHKLYNSLLKYGFDSHKVEVVWKGNVLDMLRKELEIGTELCVLTKETGLNILLPKVGEIYSSASQEFREKMSRIKKGIKPSQSTREKMSLARRGKPRNKEEMERLRLSNIGRIPTEEHRKKIGDFHRGKIVSEETKRRMRHPKKGKKIMCVEDDIVFNKVQEAADFYKVSRTCISNILIGRAKKLRNGKTFIKL